MLLGGSGGFLVDGWMLLGGRADFNIAPYNQSKISEGTFTLKRGTFCYEPIYNGKNGHHWIGPMIRCVLSSNEIVGGNTTFFWKGHYSFIGLNTEYMP